MFDPNDIIYLIPLDEDASEGLYDQEGFSIFQGFSAGILGALISLDKISELPASVGEFNLNRQRCISMRVCARYTRKVLPIIDGQFPSLADVVGEYKYRCILFKEIQKKYVDIFESKVSYKSLLCCVDCESCGDVAIGDLNKRSMYEHFRRLKMIRSKNKYVEHHSINRNITYAGHLTCLPGILTLRQFQIMGNEKEYFSSKDIEEYKYHILRIASEVRRLRCNLAEYKRITPELIITAPAIYKPYYKKNKGKYLSEDLKIIDRVMSALRKQEGYVFEFNYEGKRDNDLLLPLLNVRALEARAYTSAISNMASSSFTPVIRYPYGVNRFQSDLLRFAECSRGSNPQRYGKLSRLRKEISSKIMQSGGEDFYQFICDSKGGI